MKYDAAIALMLAIQTRTLLVDKLSVETLQWRRERLINDLDIIERVVVHLRSPDVIFETPSTR